MAIGFSERPNSRTATGNSLKIKYLFWGTESTFDVRSYVVADTDSFPPFNGADPQLVINYADIDISQVGDLTDHWDVTVPWVHPTKKNQQQRREERADYSWHWELRGRVETARITRAFESKVQKKADAALAASTMTLIGYDKASGAIEGADVPVHARELVVSFYLPTELFTTEFVDQVEAAHGKLNNAEFLGRAAGRVLFVDSNFSSDHENYQNVKLDYTFWIGRQYSIELEGFAQPVVVPPHWILDVWTETKDDPDPEIGMRAFPVVAYVHNPYEKTDLSFLMPTAESGSGE